LLDLGKIDEARTFLAGALAAREEIGDRHGMAAIEMNFAECSLRLGDLKEARRALARAKALAAQLGEPQLSHEWALLEGRRRLAMRDSAGAVEILRLVFEGARPLGRTLVLEAAYWLARAHLDQGAVEEGAALGREALRLARPLGSPRYRRLASRLAARIK